MKVKHIDEIVKCIKDEPKKYLSEETILNINSFLRGYIGILIIIGYSSDLDYIYRSNYPKWLENWIKKNIDKKYTMNSFAWSQMLYAVSLTEKEALDLFYCTSSQFFEQFYNKRIEEKSIYNSIKSNKGSVEEDISYMKQRPGMYIIKNKVSCIYHYLSGYLMALEYLENDMNESDKSFQKNFSSWLDQWIVMNKDEKWNEKTVYWDKTLEKNTESEEEAFNLFFDLSEQFFRDFHAGKIEIT